MADFGEYKGWRIVHRRGGWDAINTRTGQWFTRPTLRRLKWAISVFTNIAQELK